MKLSNLQRDHYIIVDDSEIKEGDCYIKLDNNLMFSTLKGSNPHIVEKYCKKITHSTPNVGGFSALLIAGVKELSLSEVKELIGEVDVESIAEDKTNIRILRHKTPSQVARQYFDGYVDGYNQALEDNKDKKYTEEDMKVAITQAFLSGLERLEDFERVQEMILDNIKPKTEWEVEFDENGKLILV